MTCFNPKYATYKYGRIYDKAYITQTIGKDRTGKPITQRVYYNLPTHHLGKKISFVPKANFDKNATGQGNIIIPCGKCLGCRLDKAKEWGIRGLLEAQNWKKNCFITLTYDNKHLKSRNLQKRDIQLFLKKLRKQHLGDLPREYKGKTEYPIRYFYSGEYGPLNFRPHFHIGIFNWRPNDLKLWKITDDNTPTYLSNTVSKLWGNGFILVEDMNYYTAQYIGRYTAKKCFGLDDEKIKSKGLTPEFIETSRRGGLAYSVQNNTEIWEKMKRNFGFWRKDKRGNLKLDKIPNFLKQKWKKENDLEYFEKSDKHAKQAEKNIIDKTKESGYTINEYLEIQKRSLIYKLRSRQSLKRAKTEQRI